MATYRSGKITKEKIINASRRLFYENGIETVSLARIAAEADVDVNSIVYHFHSFEGLVITVRDMVRDEREKFIRKKLDGIMSPDEHLDEALVIGVFDCISMKMFIEDPNYYRFLRSVYFNMSYKHEQSITVDKYINALNLKMHKDQRALITALIKPYQYVAPDIMISMGISMDPTALWRFYITNLLKFLGMPDSFINDYKAKVEILSKAFSVKCDESMRVS